jgi:hypothetical protein
MDRKVRGEKDTHREGAQQEATNRERLRDKEQ